MGGRLRYRRVMEGRRDHAALSEAAFLAWAEPKDGRFELVEGAIVMQAGASRDHERVAKAVFATLYAQVDPVTFDVNKGDFGVRVGDGAGRGSVLYPDVVVDRQSGDGDERVTTMAIVVAEVLSPSTDLAHHVRKLERYKRLECLVSYLVFDQKAPIVRVWRKEEDGWWPEPMVVDTLDARIELPEIGAAVRLAAVYPKPTGGQP